MSRYLGPRVRIERRLGPLPSFTRKRPNCSIKLWLPTKYKRRYIRGKKKGKFIMKLKHKAIRMLSPGQHGHAIVGKKRKRLVGYALRLQQKQRLRYNYHIGERQLVNYFERAKRAKGPTGSVLLFLLEMRLDNLVFRLGFAPTIVAARQLVNHGHVYLNGQKNTIASQHCQVNDLIQIKRAPRSERLAWRWLKQLQQTASWFKRRDIRRYKRLKRKRKHKRYGRGPGQPRPLKPIHTKTLKSPKLIEQSKKRVKNPNHPSHMLFGTKKLGAKLPSNINLKLNPLLKSNVNSFSNFESKMLIQNQRFYIANCKSNFFAKNPRASFNLDLVKRSQKNSEVKKKPKNPFDMAKDQMRRDARQPLRSRLDAKPSPRPKDVAKKKQPPRAKNIPKKVQIRGFLGKFLRKETRATLGKFQKGQKFRFRRIRTDFIPRWRYRRFRRETVDRFRRQRRKVKQKKLTAKKKLLTAKTKLLKAQNRINSNMTTQNKPKEAPNKSQSLKSKSKKTTANKSKRQKPNKIKPQKPNKIKPKKPNKIEPKKLTEIKPKSSLAWLCWPSPQDEPYQPIDTIANEVVSTLNPTMVDPLEQKKNILNRNKSQRSKAKAVTNQSPNVFLSVKNRPGPNKPDKDAPSKTTKDKNKPNKGKGKPLSLPKRPPTQNINYQTPNRSNKRAMSKAKEAFWFNKKHRRRLPHRVKRIPNFLKCYPKSLTGFVYKKALRKDIRLKVSESLIVEYYART